MFVLTMGTLNYSIPNTWADTNRLIQDDAA